MFDHAKGFQVHNSRFNEVRDGNMYLSGDHTSIVGSGNSYNTNYSNSFNNNSRREYVTRHEATHHHGPVNNIGSASNVNLGDNYGTLRQENNVTDTEGWEEYPEDEEDSFSGHEPQQYPGHLFNEHGHQHFSYDAQDPSSPYAPREDRGRFRPFPGSRTQTEPPTEWGSRNPYLNRHSGHYGFEQPSSRAPPPPRSAPPDFSDSYTRSHYQSDSGYRGRDRSLDSDRASYESRREYHPPTGGRSRAHLGNPPRANHHPRSSQYPSSEYAGSSSQGGRSRFGDGQSRSPSPQYSDVRQREDRHPREYEDGERLRRRRNRDEFDPVCRAMDSVDRATAKFSRMGL